MERDKETLIRNFSLRASTQGSRPDHTGPPLPGHCVSGEARVWGLGGKGVGTAGPRLGGQTDWQQIR